MVDIQSKEVIDKISDELKVQPALVIPRELSKQIQLSYGVNPPKNIQGSAVVNLSDSSSVTIITAHAIKRTFITGAWLSIAKSVAATSLFTELIFTPRHSNAATSIIRVRYEPVTAGSFTQHVEFPHPIELLQGSVVGIINSTAVASIDVSAAITFYETDPQ